MRELVAETLAKSREDLVQQFSAADGSNPLADFKAGTSACSRGRRGAPARDPAALLRQLGELEKQLQALRAEKDKLEEVEAERERGTAKGRTFEEAVVDAVDAHRRSRRATSPRRSATCTEATGKVGDVVVAIDACNGPARGRIVFEAKDRRLSKPKALAELDSAMAERSADFAVLVVPTEDEAAGQARAAARVQRRQAGGRARPGRRARCALELAYRARAGARADERSDAEGIDAGGRPRRRSSARWPR